MSAKQKTENYKFFQHTECEYFPCHEGADEENFNCLFCYCPLYLLKDGCGGNYEYMEGTGIKDCSKCLIPHGKGGFDHVMARSMDVIKAAKK